ncbi:MAG: alpha/beta fold hydrolase [Dyella sp.]
MPTTIQPSLPPRQRSGATASLKLAALRTAFAVGGRVAPTRTVAAAARLLCTPFASSRSRAQAVSAASGVGHAWLVLEGERLAIYEWGDPQTQPYVLLAHGWSSFGLRFLPWIEGLRAQGYAVLAFDQRGHGYSEGTLCSLPDFARIIGAIGRHYGEAAWAIAHSLGGAALVLAQDEHWRARGMILLAPAIDPLAATARFGRFIRLREALQPRLHAQLQRHTGISIHALDVRAKVDELHVPALIVHDRDDHDVPQAEGEELARRWRGARWLPTQGLGHRDVLSDPAVIAQGLAFMREGSPTTRG